MGVWIPVFSLNTQHEYFANGPCGALEFIPTQNCERVVLNQGMMLRRKPGELTAFADISNTTGDTDVTHFDFFVFSRDSQFLNYTEGLSLHEEGGYFLSGEAAGKTTDIQLSRQAYVSEVDYAPASVIPAGLQYAGLPAPILLVRIATTVRNAPEVHFTIPMQARRINWHYFITGASQPGSQLYVGSKKDKKDFEFCGDVALPNGQTASHFRSKKPLPVLYRQDTVFSLFEQEAIRPVVKSLPTPKLNLMGSENLKKKQELSSQMYVNL